MEKTKDGRLANDRLPPLSNSLVPYNENGLHHQVNNTNAQNDMTPTNGNSESPYNLHNCLFSKNSTYPNNNYIYPVNQMNQMGGLNGPIYVAVKPMNLGPMLQNNMMRQPMNGGDGKLILKATSSQSQQIIQIPLSQASLINMPQMQMQQNRQISSNRMYGVNTAYQTVLNLDRYR